MMEAGRPLAAGQDEHEEVNARGFVKAAQTMRLAVFGFDSAEASQVRRIRTLIALGHDVQAYSLRRGTGPIVTDFPNIHLGYTQHEELGRRVGQVALAILRMVRHRRRLRGTQLILARNLDMLVIAVTARWLAGARHVPLIYECLDIHRLMVMGGAKSRLLRWIERRLLARSRLLVVSSPCYLTEYFERYQQFHGQSALWQNKVVPVHGLPARPLKRPSQLEGPVRLGWVGSIRCAESLKVLCDTARQLASSIEIHIHGQLHEHALSGFHARIGEHFNVHFHGPYRYPQDLLRVYSSFDLVWNIDLRLRGGNSDWALSNRIYEAAWCGCPSLALRGTAIAGKVEEEQLGWVLPNPTQQALAQFLSQLTHADLQTAGSQILEVEEANFCSNGQDVQDALAELLAK